MYIVELSRSKCVHGFSMSDGFSVFPTRKQGAIFVWVQGCSHSSDPRVRCVPGIVLPKSWVLDPSFRPLRTPATGTVGSILFGSSLVHCPMEEGVSLKAFKHPVSDQQVGIPKSWVTDLETLDLMVSDTSDPDPYFMGGTNMGPHEGARTLSTAKKPGVIRMPKTTTGALRVAKIAIVGSGFERTMPEFRAALVAVTTEHIGCRPLRRRRDLGDCYHLGRLSKSALRLFHVRRSTGFRYAVPVFQCLWVPDSGYHSLPATTLMTGILDLVNGNISILTGILDSESTKVFSGKEGAHMVPDIESAGKEVGITHCCGRLRLENMDSRVEVQTRPKTKTAGGIGLPKYGYSVVQNTIQIRCGLCKLGSQSISQWFLSMVEIWSCWWLNTGSGTGQFLVWNLLINSLGARKVDCRRLVMLLGKHLWVSLGSSIVPGFSEWYYGSRFGDMPLLLGLPSGKENGFEGVQGGFAIALWFWFPCIFLRFYSKFGYG